MTFPFWKLTATELLDLYSKGDTSPELVLDAILDRIEEVNGRLNAVVTIDFDGARLAAKESAKRWRSGESISMMDGIPITVKDNLFVRNMQATWGSLLYKDFIAPVDDLPISKLRKSGAIIFGKTNTPEFALSGYTDNKIFGLTSNPWNIELTPGGSSGGAVAAVSSGMGSIAIATDAGGSIRRPCAHTGLIGLKPTVGRVPRRFGFPNLTYDLQSIGAVARSVADLRIAFTTMAISPPKTQKIPKRFRIGCLPSLSGVPMQKSVRKAFSISCTKLEEMGHFLEEINIPWDIDEVNTIFSTLAACGVARTVAEHQGWQKYVTESIAVRAKMGEKINAIEYIKILDKLAEFRWRLREYISQFDFVATPATPALAWAKKLPFPAYINDIKIKPEIMAAFTTAINLAGLPALVLPSPVPFGDLPAGLQLIGSAMSEEVLLDIAQRFEDFCPWPRLAPLEL